MIDPQEEQSAFIFDGWQDHEITDHLYSVGLVLLSEAQQRSAQLDSKALSILTWGCGVNALLLASEASWEPHVYAKWVSLGAAVAAVVAICFAASVYKSKKWKWFTRSTWLKCYRSSGNVFF